MDPPLCGCLILLSLVWLQTELESAQSFYHCSQLFASKWNGFDFILPGLSAHQSSTGDQQQPQGPCNQALKAVQQTEQTHALKFLLPSLYHNKYIPHCNKHGYFKPMQCNRHRTKCWCVDKWGNKKGKHSKGDPDELDCS